ncbi:hypothetical protein Ae717Ps2_3046 [Pseudonocardia sp. Ae717_Ps2]|uniref:DUF7218 family protein n=1 Tax=Pseudonocardia sp. Ae717_Ps2 TaxID=1885573 RepID=UPI00094B2B54|nr:Rho termination factor N-terminal domain-containing protein [Pseudonocardia sp. Ae717_Ps2]OLM32151.1 hypothetical protein Ae717Ps2_3046 [Pseudonocardia sp. Ae717_Ps2]
MANSIKDEEMHERLREEGNSKEKSARIANAAAAQGRDTVGRRGGEHGDYENQTRDELYAQAQKVGIEGRSDMTKDELIEALRKH